MKFTASLTNRAVLLSDKNIRGNRCQIDCEVDDLSRQERVQIVARLHDDRYVCEGVVNDNDEVEPRLDHYNQSVLLRVTGTEPGDLTDALEADEREVREYLARRMGAK